MDREIKWEENVVQAKTLVTKRDDYQMEIATLCLQVCEISRGGNKEESLFTVKRFAEEIGMSHKTLYNWIDLKRLVYDQLEDDLKQQASYSKMQLLRKSMRPHYTGVQINKLARDWWVKDDINAKLARYCCDLRALSRNFEDPFRVDGAEEKIVEQILFYCTSIIQNATRFKPTAKPRYHEELQGVVQKHGGKPRRVPVAGKYIDEDGFEIKITEKDIKVANYLIRYKSNYVSPTVIGTKVAGHNKSSASAWACRSLNKLHALGYAKKNKDGHYMFTEKGGF